VVDLTLCIHFIDFSSIGGNRSLAALLCGVVGGASAAKTCGTPSAGIVRRN